MKGKKVEKEKERGERKEETRGKNIFFKDGKK